MKPSDFLKHPYDSIFQHIETEIVARNIMVILSRTGDTFRRITWGEYRTERTKDGSFDTLEHKEFDRVIGYCVSADTARLFSPEWKSVGQEA